MEGMIQNLNQVLVALAVLAAIVAASLHLIVLVMRREVKRREAALRQQEAQLEMLALQAYRKEVFRMPMQVVEQEAMRLLDQFLLMRELDPLPALRLEILLQRLPQTYFPQSPASERDLLQGAVQALGYRGAVVALMRDAKPEKKSDSQPLLA